MKNFLIATLLLVTNALAHPGPVGHTHGEVDEWPFPELDWPMIAVGIGLLAVVAFVVKTIANKPEPVRVRADD